MISSFIHVFRNINIEYFCVPGTVRDAITFSWEKLKYFLSSQHCPALDNSWESKQASNGMQSYPRFGTRGV
jgi:hypothetical protein